MKTDTKRAFEMCTIISLIVLADSCN